MNLEDVEIVLASYSKARKMLFEQVGLKFEVIVSGVDETTDDTLTPEETVEELCRRKADAVFKGNSSKLVVAADSLVSIDDRILGKPDGPKGADEMLHMLSGRVHRLLTGVCIRYKDKERVFHMVTEVEFFDLTDEEITAYVATGEPLEKAGSYGIEGMGISLVKSINGDYASIVGIPVGRVLREIKIIINQ